MTVKQEIKKALGRTKVTNRELEMMIDEVCSGDYTAAETVDRLLAGDIN